MIISPRGKHYFEHRIFCLRETRPVVWGCLVQEGYEAEACWRGYIHSINATRPHSEPEVTFIAIEPLLLTK